MKTTYALGTSDDGYCLHCGTLGDCIDWLFYNQKNSYYYREITDYTIWKLKHPENLKLDYGMGGDCYLLNENGEIPEENDEIMEKGEIVKLTKSDLYFIKNHLPINH